MTIGEILKEGIRILNSAGIKTPKTDTEIIISYVLGINRFEIYIRSNEELKEEDENKIIELINQRSKNTPLEYLTGYKYFWGMKFEVKKGVLIPRFDTESLIEIARLTCRNPTYILDIGTGTGIIGITLKRIFPDSYVIMTDISDTAIEICKKNIIGVLGKTEGIEVIKSDVFEDIWEKIGWGKFDLIISNPPYISKKDYEKLSEDVKKEPFEALYGGINGLDFYIKIANRSKEFLKNNGKIILEVGDQEQAIKVKKIFYLKGFRNFLTFKDINNNIRGVVIMNY